MKKVLLSTAALAGLALVAAAPVRADEPALQLGLGGYISGYAVHTSQDEPTGVEYRSFDFRKDTEVHLSGEVALDNGITAGAHLELLNDRFDDGTVEESYLYLSSSWGRVNLGEEDGIAYLIQVAPPSADEKVDGARPDIGTFQGAGSAGNMGGTLSFAQDPFAYGNKFTYITPVFNGFQAGFSYQPGVTNTDLDGLAQASIANSAGVEWENGWEVAARYEGSFDAIDLALGAGYSHASQEDDTVATDEDLRDWNVAATIGYGAFGFGAAYINFDETGTQDQVTDGWVLGADYVTGPYKLGLQYVTVDTENGTGTRDTEVDRWTVGGIYEWGPGMTFRGAVQFQDAEDVGGVATADRDGTQITLGTQLNF